MDRQAWIVVTFCIVGLIGWQIYVARHTPVTPRPATALPTPSVAISAPPNASPTSGSAPSATPSQPLPIATPTPAAQPFAEKTVNLRNDDLELLLTNRGGGVAEAVLPKHKGEDGRPVKLNANQPLPIGALIEKPEA